MKVRAPRLVAGLAVTITAGALALPSFTQPAGADPITFVGKVLENPSHVVFVVEDLGGGAYWVPTTGIHYVVKTGSELLLNGDDTVADLIAVLQANGRDLLLLVNGAILVPVKEALGGQD